MTEAEKKAAEQKGFAQMTEKELTESLSKIIGTVINDVLPVELEKESKKMEESISKSLSVTLSNRFMDSEQQRKASLERCVEFMDVLSKNFHGSSLDVKSFNEQAVEDLGYTEKAMSSLTPGAGGVLVPEVFEAGILRIAESVGLARLLPAQLTTRREVINFNTETTRVTVAYTDQLSQITESDAVLATNQVNVKKLAGITTISSELLEDADIDVITYLMTTFGEALAEAEDAEFLTGDGTNFQGIFDAATIPTAAMATGNTAFSDVTAQNLRDMIAVPKESQLTGAGYIMHRSIWNLIQQLVDDAGQFIVTQGLSPIITPTTAFPSTVGRAVGFLWGYPVWLSDQAPAASASAADTEFIAFGNFKNGYRFYKRKGMEFAIGTEATIGSVKLFEQDAIALRVIERHAMGIALGGSMTTLKSSAT